MRITLWAGLVTVLAACSDDPTSPPPVVGVVQATPGLTFQPSQATIRVNRMITWEFGAVPHNVTFTAVAGRPADIPVNTNTSIARTFATSGTFSYQCTIHPGMRGTVVVTPDSPSSPYALPFTR